MNHHYPDTTLKTCQSLKLRRLETAVKGVESFSLLYTHQRIHRIRFLPELGRFPQEGDRH